LGRIFKVLVSTAAIVVLAGVSNPSKTLALPSERPAIASHLYFPEVRLRKLHLVRPDLIPYPIFYDIYC
jgi:hypothetical protein